MRTSARPPFPRAFLCGRRSDRCALRHALRHTLPGPVLAACFSTALLAASLVFGGLLPLPEARADQGLNTATQVDQRTRRYPGEDARHVTERAAHVFELAQAGYRIIYGKQGVIASREWGWETIVDQTMDLGLGGQAYWYVDATQNGPDVVVRVRCVAEPDPFTPLDAEALQGRPGPLVDARTLAPETPQPDEDAKADALYAVFFNRLDVLLGQNRHWLYCRAAEEYAKMERFSGGLDAWCLEAGDARPGTYLAPAKPQGSQP